MDRTLSAVNIFKIKKGSGPEQLTNEHQGRSAGFELYSKGGGKKKNPMKSDFTDVKYVLLYQ